MLTCERARLKSFAEEEKKPPDGSGAKKRKEDWIPE